MIRHDRLAAGHGVYAAWGGCSRLTPSEGGWVNFSAGLGALIPIALSGRERSFESELHLFI